MRFPRPAPWAALPLAWLAVAPSAFAQIPMRNMTLKSHFDDYPSPSGGTNYSACWSYIHSDGREYAVIGAGGGTAIYNVTNPGNAYRVGFIPGPNSPWREMKSYRNWIYVVSEGGGTGEGLQIIRMTDPEHPALAATYTANFHLAHTVSVDTARALLVCNGTRLNLGGGNGYSQAGMRILSIANPEAPVERSYWPAIALPIPDSLYVHDCVMVGNRLYASSVYSGILRVLDVTDPAAPTQIASWTYPGAFTHNSWPDASGNWLYVTDEVNGQLLKIFNISNLASPVLFDGFTPNPAAIVHNAHVKGSELYLSSYTEGVRILDASDPGHPAEFAWADSWPGPSGWYNGVWEVCPYFPSGTVIASDRTTGLYVYRPIRHYGVLRAQVIDGGTNQPIAKTRVFLDGSADSLATALDGIGAFAPNPGSHTLTAHRFGYENATATASVGVGSNQTLNLVLKPKPTGSLSGVVRDAGTLSPLSDAEVTLDYTPLHAHTDAAGQYAFPSVPADAYRVEVHRAGYVPLTFNRDIAPTANTLDVLLVPVSSYDALETPTPWVVGATGDQATSGIWVRVDPLGTGTAAAAPALGLARASRNGAPLAHEEKGFTTGPVQPEDDNTPAPGTMCFVTGQGTNSALVDENDVDGGRTSLTTPPLDGTGMSIPTIGYWRWFYSNGDGERHWLAVLISGDGTTWVPVDTTRGVWNEWQEKTIRIADYVAPSDQVRLRFQAADFGAYIVEAGIDDLTLFDAGGPTGFPLPPPPTRLAFAAPRPNPARGAVELTLETGGGALAVEILDLAGRRVRTLFQGPAPPGTLRLPWRGTDDHGRRLGAGLYFARARTGGEESVTRFAFVP